MKASLLLKSVNILGFCWVAGCGNPVSGGKTSIDDNHTPGTSLSAQQPTVLMTGGEFVTASGHSQITGNSRFIVSGSLVNSTGEIQQTTSRGYVLFSNIQGMVLSAGGGL